MIRNRLSSNVILGSALISLLYILVLPSEITYADSIAVDASCSLANAITAANTDTATVGCAAGSGADTITLAADITLSAALPSITSNITVNGSGYTVSGDESYRIFVVGSSGTLTVNRVRAIKGVESGFYNDGGTLTVSNSAFSQNTSRNGGAIYNRGTTIVNNSTFSSNSVNRYGGAIYSGGRNASLTITNSTFSSNTASGAWAGAVQMEGTNSVATITNSTFTGNSAAWGGAVRSGGNNTQVTISNSTFSGNTATNSSSGTISTSGSPTLVFNLRNNIIAGSTGADCSGNIDQNIANLIEDGTCSPALSGDPMLGALTGSPAYFPLLQGSPAIDAANATYCPATDQTGANRPSSAACDLGAYESGADRPTATFTATATSTATATPTATGPSATPSATATPTYTATAIPFKVTLNGTACHLWDAISAANTDAAAGSCPAGSGADTITLTANITLDRWLPDVTTTITLEGGGYSINGAGNYQIFEVIGASFTVNNVTLSNGYDSAHTRPSWPTGLGISGGSSSNPVFSFGGAIRVRSSGSLTVSSSTLSSNSARYGGAIAAFDSTLSLRNSTISGNMTTGYGMGGAIYSHNSTVSSTNVAYSSNSAVLGVGGAVSLNQGSATIIGGSFNNNAAQNAAALNVVEVALSINGTSFNDNNATTTGGAIRSIQSAPSSTTTSITNVSFERNSAEGGEAIYVHTGPLTISGSTFEENSAGSTGGALDTSGGPVSIDNSTFDNNSSGNGGAFFVNAEAHEELSIRGSIIINNSSSNGGAFYVVSGLVNISSSSLTANRANPAGGAFFIQGGQTSIVNSAIADNYALFEGGAVAAIGGRQPFPTVRYTRPIPTATPIPPTNTPAPPGRPTNLTASIVDNGVELSWDAPEGQVDGYQILRRRPHLGEDTLKILVADTGSSATTYSDTTATESTRYTYRVKAILNGVTGRRSKYARVDR